MRARAIVIVAACAALGGSAIGAFGASWYWLRFNADWMSSAELSRTQADLIERIAVLDAIRAGRAQDAAKWIEVLVDGDLVATAALARGGHALSANARQAIAREILARKRMGYKPVDPQLSGAVAQALRVLAPPGVREPGAPSPAVTH